MRAGPLTDTHLIVDLVLAILAAFVGGTIARQLRQPVVLGYLLAGVVIGPSALRLTADPNSIQVLAEIGVAFLMFALGAEFSFAELRRFGRIATVGGSLQIGTSLLIGPLLAPALGLTLTQGLFVGALLALSSTVVVLKVLQERGESQTLHGRVALGILIVQDLAVVPLVIILPALAIGSNHLVRDLATAALKAGAVILAAYIIGIRAVPWLLNRAAIVRARELFVLGVVGLALGTALLTEIAGLSIAFGAFLAGLVVAESEYRTQVIAEVLPLRDLFSALFFVSVGMLINPLTLAAHLGVLLPLLVIVILVKVVVVTLATLFVGMPGRVALLTGLSLGQVGEFSFVLAKIGVDQGAIPVSLFDLTLALALITIILTPSYLAIAPHILRALERLPLVGSWWTQSVEGDPRVESLRRHVVICGYGRVGRELAAALTKRGLSYVVIEYNPAIVRELRAQDVPVIYGDAANHLTLENAHIGEAVLLAALVPDITTAELATRNARQMSNSRLTIVARVARAEDVARLREAGATAVVQPEFEAGVEVIRHTLQRYGISERELTHVVAGRRNAYYGRGPDV